MCLYQLIDVEMAVDFSWWILKFNFEQKLKFFLLSRLRGQGIELPQDERRKVTWEQRFQGSLRIRESIYCSMQY